MTTERKPSRGLIDALRSGKNSVSGLVARVDGWANELTGMGTTRDKTFSTSMVANAPLQVEELFALFHHDDMAQRIVSAIPDESFKLGFTAELSIAEEDDAEEMDASPIEVDMRVELDRLRALDVFHEAFVWGRLLGGAGVFVGTNNGTDGLDEPLDDSRVVSVDFLRVVDRSELFAREWYDDPSSDKFGEPSIYEVNPAQQGNSYAPAALVHESRIVMFGGAITARKERARNNGWDHSVLQKLIDVLRSTNNTWGSVCSMMSDLSQSVYKIQGLIDMIAEGDKDTMRTRMALMDTVRSITRAIVLDSEQEDFKLVERGSVVGVDAILDRTYQRLAAAARMPITILMGQAPSGLNATSGTDLRWWYDSVRVAQEHTLKPRLERLVKMISVAQHSAIDPDGWQVVFPSLWQLTPAEEAGVRNQTAQTDKIYVDMGAVLPEEIAISRLAGERGDSPTTGYDVDLSVRRKLLEAEYARVESRSSAEELSKAPAVNPASVAVPTTKPPPEADPDQNA